MPTARRIRVQSANIPEAAGPLPGVPLLANCVPAVAMLSAPCSRALKLHPHHLLIGRYRLVADRQRQLKGHIRLLRGNHRLVHVDAGTSHQPVYGCACLIFKRTDLAYGIRQQVAERRRG